MFGAAGRGGVGVDRRPLPPPPAPRRQRRLAPPAAPPRRRLPPHPRTDGRTHPGSETASDGRAATTKRRSPVSVRHPGPPRPRVAPASGAAPSPPSPRRAGPGPLCKGARARRLRRGLRRRLPGRAVPLGGSPGAVPATCSPAAGWARVPAQGRGAGPSGGAGSAAGDAGESAAGRRAAAHRSPPGGAASNLQRRSGAGRALGNRCLQRPWHGGRWWARGAGSRSPAAPRHQGGQGLRPPRDSSPSAFRRCRQLRLPLRSRLVLNAWGVLNIGLLLKIVPLVTS